MKITLPMLNDYLMQDRWTPHHPDIPFTMRTAVDRVECEDGFNVSIQAGEHNYSKPRDNNGPWTEFECGFPSAHVEDWAERLDGEQYDSHASGVFAYVPAPSVILVLMKHGGPTQEWMRRNYHEQPVEYAPLKTEQESEARLAVRIHSHPQMKEKCYYPVALVERGHGFALLCPNCRWVPFRETEAIL